MRGLVITARSTLVIRGQIQLLRRAGRNVAFGRRYSNQFFGNTNKKGNSIMKILQIIVILAVGIGIGLMIRISSGKQELIDPQSSTERLPKRLCEGVFSPIHPDWQRMSVEIKKTSTNFVYEVICSGSNGAAEPYDEVVFVVRQLPRYERIQIINAFEYECTPVVDSDEIKREGGEMAPERRKLMSMMVKDNLLIVNGLAYDLGEGWPFGCIGK